MKYKVVEKFISINGEGNLAGELAVFIRFAGCNLKCSYCDTTWANKPDVEFEYMTETEIFNYIKSTKIKNVTLTGGEPLIQQGIEYLLELLVKDDSINVEVETNGTINIAPFINFSSRKLAFTIDYKSKSVLTENPVFLENCKYLRSNDVIKFVVENMEDLETANEIIKKYNLLEKCKIHISTVFGRMSWSDVVEYMKEKKLNGVKLQPQIHKVIWEANKRGV